MVNDQFIGIHVIHSFRHPHPTKQRKTVLNQGQTRTCFKLHCIKEARDHFRSFPHLGRSVIKVLSVLQLLSAFVADQVSAPLLPNPPHPVLWGSFFRLASGAVVMSSWWHPERNSFMMRSLSLCCMSACETRSEKSVEVRWTVSRSYDNLNNCECHIYWCRTSEFPPGPVPMF